MGGHWDALAIGFVVSFVTALVAIRTFLGSSSGAASRRSGGTASCSRWRTGLSSSADLPAAAYDGVAAADLARLLTVPRLVVHERVGSTMDVAHALAAGGAPARHARGWRTHRQAAAGAPGGGGRRRPGRGSGRPRSRAPRPPRGWRCCRLRVGLALAAALDPLAPSPIRIKWPNDLQLADGRKLAGILVEARWRATRVPSGWRSAWASTSHRPPSCPTPRDSAWAFRACACSRRSWPRCVRPPVEPAHSPTRSSRLTPPAMPSWPSGLQPVVGVVRGARRSPRRPRRRSRAVELDQPPSSSPRLGCRLTAGLAARQHRRRTCLSLWPAREGTRLYTPATSRYKRQRGALSP
jgi:hypothetical protein